MEQLARLPPVTAGNCARVIAGAQIGVLVVACEPLGNAGNEGPPLRKWGRLRGALGVKPPSVVAGDCCARWLQVGMRDIASAGFVRGTEPCVLGNLPDIDLQSEDRLRSNS